MSEMSKSTLQTAFDPEQDEDSNASTWSAGEFEETIKNKSDERATPTWFVEMLHDAIGGLFDLDPCSGAEPETDPIATTRFNKSDDGLSKSWQGYMRIFINPPYSDLPNWLRKIFVEISQKGPDSPELVLCLLPSYSSSSEAFQEYARAASYISLIKGRLTFQGQSKQAPFSSLLLVFGDLDEESELARVLDDKGTLYSRAEISTAQDNGELQKLLTDGGAAAVANPSASSQGPTTESLATPTIADVSLAAPAVPQGVIDLRRIAIGDELHVSFDDATYGFPSEAPSDARLEVLAGVSESNPHDEVPNGWDTLTTYSTPTDTWAVLSQNPDDISEMRCSLSVDSRNWVDVSLTQLYRLTANKNLAINTYGKGTSYVC